MINNLLSSYLWHGYNFKEYDDKDYLMWLLSEIENNGGDDGQNDNPYAKNYLTFEALEDTTFSFARNALQYSLNGGTTWETLEANTASPTVTSGSTIMWRQTGLIPDEGGIGRFSSTGEYKAYGNVMSLYYGDDFENKTNLTGKDFAFNNLFNSYAFEGGEYIESYLIDASNLVLPATTLSIECYAGMFYGCASLTTAPELPATILANSCYLSMFDGCTSLTSAPELPATTLAERCYDSMFNGCTSLTTAPALPATTLAENCYDSMFIDCSSLSHLDIYANEDIIYLVYNNTNSVYGKLVLHGDTPLASQDLFLQQFIGWELWIDDTLIGPIEGSGGEYYDNGGLA